VTQREIAGFVEGKVMLLIFVGLLEIGDQGMLQVRKSKIGTHFHGGCLK